MKTVPEYFGSMVFDDRAMKAVLPADVYRSLKKTIDGSLAGSPASVVNLPMAQVHVHDLARHVVPQVLSLIHIWYILSLWRQARESRAEGGCLADCLQWEARVSDDRVRACLLYTSFPGKLYLG